jgi:hypothetical protein
MGFLAGFLLSAPLHAADEGPAEPGHVEEDIAGLAALDSPWSQHRGREIDTLFIIDDYWQLDLQYSYLLESLKAVTLRLGCRNFLDADPPLYNYPVPGELLHEGRGALLYARWTQPFN